MVNKKDKEICMRGPGTGTLLLTTLLSVVGWLMVTLYSTGEALSEDVHRLAIQVNTLEVLISNPPESEIKNFYILKDSIGAVKNEHTVFKMSVLRRFDLIDARIDTIVFRAHSGEELVVKYSGDNDK